MGIGWRRRTAARALGALAVLAGVAGLLPLGPAARVAPAAAQAPAQGAAPVWQLERVEHADNDGRAAALGLATYTAQAGATGGSVTLTVQGDRVCPPGPPRGSETFEFRWRFDRDVTRVAQGDRLTLTWEVESKGAQAPCVGGPDGSIGPLTWANVTYSPDLAARRAAEWGCCGPNKFRGGEGEFHPHPHPSHRPGPRQIEVIGGDASQKGFFALSMFTREAITVEVVYLYAPAPAAQPPPPAPPPPVPPAPPPAQPAPPADGCPPAAGWDTRDGGVVPVGLPAGAPHGPSLQAQGQPKCPPPPGWEEEEWTRALEICAGVAFLLTVTNMSPEELNLAIRDEAVNPEAHRRLVFFRTLWALLEQCGNVKALPTQQPPARGPA